MADRTASETTEHSPTSPPRAATVVATAVTLVGFLAFAIIAAADPEHFDHLARKDNFANTGLVEHLTVGVLIPGILLAIYALIRYRRLLPSRWITLWLVLWTLACIYFAGEECSWGQWYLEFETPEQLSDLNDQGEFNLHNTSSWLDQKPRTLVEIFVVVGGLIIPVVLWLNRKKPTPRPEFRRLLDWTLAPAMCWAAAGAFLFERIASKIEVPWFERLGTSEFRELGVAWFLTLYLMSYALRLGSLSKSRLNAD